MGNLKFYYIYRYERFEKNNKRTSFIGKTN